MQDKKVFREVFNFFVKYRDMIGHVDRQAFWASVSEELGKLGAELGNTDFVQGMLVAVYLELERRDSMTNAAAGQPMSKPHGDNIDSPFPHTTRKENVL